MQIDPILGKKHLASAWKDLVAVRDEYYAKSRNASPSRKAELGKELKKAGNRYQNILYKLNGLLTESQKAQHDAELDLARAIVLQAERALEKVKDGPNPDKVALAEQTLASAEATLAVSQRQWNHFVGKSPNWGRCIKAVYYNGRPQSKIPENLPRRN